MSRFHPKAANTVPSDVPALRVDRLYPVNVVISAAKAVAADDDGVLAATALTGQVQQIVAGITSPAVPRNIQVVGNAAGIAGNVVIHGTNYAGAVITETIALNGITAVEGSSAFKTVTRIDFPIETHVGTDTVSVGWGDKLGLPYRLTRNTVQAAYLNNVIEATAPTVTVSDDLEGNTVKLNSALNGTAVNIELLV